MRRLTHHALESKKSNVVLSADLTTTKELLEIADGKRAPVPSIKSQVHEYYVQHWDHTSSF